MFLIESISTVLSDNTSLPLPLFRLKSRTHLSTFNNIWSHRPSRHLYSFRRNKKDVILYPFYPLMKNKGTGWDRSSQLWHKILDPRRFEVEDLSFVNYRYKIHRVFLWGTGPETTLTIRRSSYFELEGFPLPYISPTRSLFLTIYREISVKGLKCLRSSVLTLV